MGEMSKKYLIDTEENRQFLKEINENLLSFGHKFPSPEEALTIWARTELPGRRETVKPGLLPVWLMCTASELFWDMKAAKNWQPQPSKV